MLRLSENKPPDFPEIDQIRAYNKSRLPDWLRGTPLGGGLAALNNLQTLGAELVTVAGSGIFGLPAVPDDVVPDGEVPADLSRSGDIPAMRMEDMLGGLAETVLLHGGEILALDCIRMPRLVSQDSPSNRSSRPERGSTVTSLVAVTVSDWCGWSIEKLATRLPK
jgi:hypothetical protein